jgi:hypothetical protein
MASLSYTLVNSWPPLALRLWEEKITSQSDSKFISFGINSNYHNLSKYLVILVAVMMSIG